MSSLWTPGGEVPVGREPTDGAGTPPEPDGAEAAGAGHGPAPDPEELEAMRRQLLDAPAADVVAHHLMAIYELAVLHLSAPSPRLSEVRLAIDSIEAVAERLGARLGDAGEALRGALPQLKLAVVEAAGGPPGGGPETRAANG